MAENTITALIARQDWLDGAANALQNVVSSSYQAVGPAGRRIKDVMHGTWLGHPVHAAVTDVPVGAWTAAVVMDSMDELSPSYGLKRGADTAVAIGLAGAAIAAVTGLTDWSATDGSARRTGLVHGLLNVAAFGLFTASFVLRRVNRRSEARALGAIGYAVAFGSAWLGGELAYKQQVGVDHTLGQHYPGEFTPVMAEAGLGDGEMRRVDLDGSRILLARRNGKVYAISEVCSHSGGPLAEGEFEGMHVTCPWHGSCFSLRDGSVVNGPAVYPALALEVRIEGGQIEVRRARP